MGNDPRGYYHSLGVSHEASIEQIKKTYRALAKIYHPDINDDPKAAERFRVISEAYDTLIDPELRKKYDETNTVSEQDAAPPEPKAKVNPVHCSSCAKPTAQPRFLVFRSVVSYIFATQTNPTSGIFCSQCAKKKALRASAISALFGWWGVPWGPINTIKEVIRNSLGGERSPEIDEKLMWQNAVAFLERGDYLLSASIATKLINSTDKGISSAASELLDLLRAQGVEPRSIKQNWRFSFPNFASQIAMVSFLPGVVAASIYLDSAQNNQISTFSSGNSAGSDNEPVIVNQCVDMPTNGEVLSEMGSKLEASHKITVENGSKGDAIVKIKDSLSRNTVAAFYVAEKSKASFDNIPDGSYVVQFANGTKLNSTCDGFLDGTYSQFEGHQKLSTQYDSTSIYTQELVFTLFPALNGNIDIDTIKAADF
ncbi:J domain-containing protein [Thalassospira profundimaris]|uniref:J domain-containing protein n=1 Tax=Thalassospira profundimaris TaxID=502049 RepID=UPI000287254D|nr:J domain-containing protein [Thalassospira profundimaris]EKF10203.1 heat shock protein DnaJ-like protein [Thalassospira profundimaris WP0211]